MIVNDGSTDQTRLEIEKLMSDLSFNVLVVDKENEGVISARYTALQYVDTEFVLGVDADDEIPPNTIERYNFLWGNLSSQEQKDYISLLILSRFPQQLHQDLSIISHILLFPKGNISARISEALLYLLFRYRQFSAILLITPYLSILFCFL